MGMVNASLVLLGEVFLYIGAAAGIVQWVIAGRFEFRFRGESLILTISVFLVNWFKGEELTFAQVIF